jgi:hypothetical protein
MSYCRSSGGSVSLSRIRCVRPWAIVGSILLLTSLVSAVTFIFCSEDDCEGDCIFACVDVAPDTCCWVDPVHDVKARSINVTDAEVDVPVECSFWASDPTDLEPDVCNGEPWDASDNPGSHCERQIGNKLFEGASYPRPRSDPPPVTQSAPKSKTEKASAKP